MIVYGSRTSELAMTQTRAVAESVAQRTGQPFRIEPFVTKGDRVVDQPLAAIGSKGLFTRELEDALRQGTIDAAVHSLKDLPVEDPADLTIGAVPLRQDPADVLVARPDARHGPFGDAAGLLAAFAPHSRIGTSSPRRALALRAARADLVVDDLRGNVPTRLTKLRRGDYAAIVLAAAGLNRLAADLGGLSAMPLPVAACAPAPGQGALAVQCRRGDQRVRALLATIQHEPTARCVAAERALLLGLGGGCSMPLGALVDEIGSGFRLRATLWGGEPPAALHGASIGPDPLQLAERLVAQWRPLVGEPLRGQRLAFVCPDGARAGLAAAMAIAGAHVVALPWTRTEALAVGAAQLDDLLGCDALAFTSRRAVRGWVAACAAAGRDPFPRPVFAVGGSTAAEALLHGCTELTAGDGSGGAALADALAAAGFAAGGTIAFPCAESHHDGLETAARRHGLGLRPLPIYRLRAVEPQAERLDVDAFVLTSPSAVAAAVHRGVLPNVERLVAIGAATANALAAAGHAPAVQLEEPSPTALLAALRAAAGAESRGDHG